LNNWTLQPFKPEKNSLAEWTREATIWSRKLNKKATLRYLNPPLKILEKNDLPKIITNMTEGLVNQKEKFPNT